MDVPRGMCLINATPLGDELRLEEDPAFFQSAYGRFSALDFFEHHLQRGTIPEKDHKQEARIAVARNLETVRTARMSARNPRDLLPEKQLKQINRVYETLWEHLIGDQVPVLVATTIARLKTTIVDLTPTLVIVDEACQVADLKFIKLCCALESCRRLSLMYLGDPQQLPPFTHLPSQEQVLDSTHKHHAALVKFQVHDLLFLKLNRLALLMDADHHNQQRQRSMVQEARPMLCHTLRTEYRMAAAVFEAARVSFYPDFEIIYAAVNLRRSQTEQDVYGVVNGMRRRIGLASRRAPGYNVITHAGVCEQAGTSRVNRTEADIVQQLTEAFEEQAGDRHTLALISPYKGQFNLLQRRLTRKVSTIDSFQGSQAEVVILSLCQVNEFTMDAYRLCVEVSSSSNRTCDFKAHQGHSHWHLPDCKSRLQVPPSGHHYPRSTEVS